MTEETRAARGSDDEYCSAYPSDGHHYVAHSVNAPPVRWVDRCQACDHISSRALRRQLGETAPRADALLGLATTRDMLREIEVRGAVGRLGDELRPFAPALLRLEQIASGLQAGLPGPVLDYRTVDS